MCKLHYFELVYGKNYSNLWKIFILRLFKMKANQSSPGLNKGLSSIFWWLRNTNHEKFIVEYVMYSEKNDLVKNIYKWSKYGFATTSLSGKDSSWSVNTLQ